jgi:SH3-like domain-containing protein
MKKYSLIFRFFLPVVLIVTTCGDALAERLTVKTSVANIRSGPGTEHDILWKVEQYHPLFIIGTSGSWYKFRDFEGDEGWIHQSLMDNIPSVVTIKKNCNVRSGPGTAFEIVFTVGKGIPFKVNKRKGNWIHIRHADGDRGWIYKTLVW